ncbi:MAG: glutamate-5-semialdehyde dehydrogenase [Alphaproteobacteria bacterium]|nr:glutamate-5-semialdehyde dehydrogenase [Alphaproteobacteria bacterium]
MKDNAMTLSPSDAADLMASWTRRARAVKPVMAVSSETDRNNALMAAAMLIHQHHDEIINANTRDVKAAQAAEMKAAFIDRLTLDHDRIEAMAKGLEDIAALPDPLGRVLDQWDRPNGLDISRVATPLGVLGVIYEARPNVTIDAAGLAVKSGNAVILRGGSSSIHTATVLAGLMRDGLIQHGLPADCVQLVDNTDRALVGAMLAATGAIDVIIPRGGKSLVERVQNDARVPVFAHLEGICHVYIDADADLDKARAISLNAKMRRVGICGAAETLLVDRAVAAEMLPAIAEDLMAAGCALRGDADSRALIPSADAAEDGDWSTEYLDAIISVRLVDGVKGAMAHIERYSSAHTETIITENTATAETFLTGVDSAIVMVNASTQFADGGEFGMGAEIGISTGRMHARGPVGADQLTSFKYVVRGNGQVRP